MNKVLRKRILRELKANYARYTALVLLIAMGMYILIGMVAGAETIIQRTAEHGENNLVEDGQFGVFIALTEEQEKQLTDKGVILEKHFSLDLNAEDGSVLRMFRNRQAIDLAELDEGRLAEKMNEAVIEKRYAEEHNLSVGDIINAGGAEFEIVGIGSTPDYDAPFAKFSDTAVSSTNFGTILVCNEMYDYIKDNTAQKAEDLCYAYRLGGAMTDEDIKQIVKDMEFNYADVTDKYYLEAVGEIMQKRDDLRDGINELYDGSKELADGIKELSDGAVELSGGLGDLYSGSEELSDGIKELSGGTGELSDGMVKLDAAGSAIADGADKIFALMLSNASNSLKAMGTDVTLTADNYSAVLDGYISQTGSYELAAMKTHLDAVKTYIDGAGEFTDGVHSAAEGATAVDEGAKALYDGASELSDGAKEAANGAKELSDGAKEAYDGAAELSNGIAELKTETDKLIDDIFDIDLDNLTSFVKRADNVRIAGAAGDVQMNKFAGLGVGVIMMVLFTYVISVFVIHQIQRESSVIGALYALGAKKKDLILHYITLPTIMALAGGIIGSAVGFSPLGVDIQMADSYAFFSLPEFDTVYPPYLFVYALVMPPVISAIVNSLVINKRLSQTALSLIKNEQKTARYSSVKLSGKNFIRRFQTRQLLREFRTSITTLLCLLFSLMILMLGLDCGFLCSNIGEDTSRDTKYEYMYTYKYPEKTVPEGGEACYAETLSKEQLGYKLDITIMGIDDDNKYFDAKPQKGRTLAAASKSVSERYGVKAGDKIILTDEANSMDYAFTITDVCDYSAGLMLFMDIDSMRELFGQEDDYFNCVLSDEQLDIDEGRLYAVSSKADIERSAGVFVDLMMGMVTMLIAVSSIIFFAVMYLMQNVIVERASFGISLVKVFGFKTKDVKRLYLNGNAIVTAIGAVVLIPTAKLLMDKVFPLMIPNVASGINLSFPLYMYPVIFVGVMIVYYIVTFLLVRKLNKITPAEVLKNRE